MVKKKETAKKNNNSKPDNGFKPGNYVITAAQALGEYDQKRFCFKGSANKRLLSGLEHCCGVNQAELIVLPMQGKTIKEDTLSEFFYEKEEKGKYGILAGNLKLNDKLSVSDMTVPPQNVDPATGRDRFVQKENSMIYAHPKQRLKAIPKSNRKLPRLLMTTGVVTTPNYNESNHRGDAAARDHTYGAVIVEVLDRRTYHVRHIRAQANGKFVDMGIKFDGKKTSIAKTEALVLGDLHCGDTDERVMSANYEMMDYFEPKRLFIHDLMSGHSFNPHEKDKLMTRARDFEEGRLNLERELYGSYEAIVDIGEAMGKGEVNIVASNHDYFLDRYLNDGEFIQEPWNLKIASKLMAKKIDGENPVEVGIRMMGDLPSNVRFLKLEDDYKVWGYQLASHGHKGMSGARGSVRSREVAHGKSITGHTHAPEILRDTYIVGTSTDLDLDYTKGEASAWMAANAVLSEGGFVQLLPIVGGRWKRDDRRKRRRKK